MFIVIVLFTRFGTDEREERQKQKRGTQIAQAADANASAAPYATFENEGMDPDECNLTVESTIDGRVPGVPF